MKETAQQAQQQRATRDGPERATSDPGYKGGKRVCHSAYLHDFSRQSKMAKKIIASEVPIT